MSKGKFLIVEDEFVVAENLRAELESMGYEVVGLASSGEKAMVLARREKPDLALMDIKLICGMNNLPVDIQLIENISISRIPAHVSVLKNDAAVLFLSHVLDDDGNVMPIAKSIQMISQASPVPVLSFWDFTLGKRHIGRKTGE